MIKQYAALHKCFPTSDLFDEMIITHRGDHLALDSIYHSPQRLYGTGFRLTIKISERLRSKLDVDDPGITLPGWDKECQTAIMEYANERLSWFRYYYFRLCANESFAKACAVLDPLVGASDTEVANLLDYMKRDRLTVAQLYQVNLYFNGLLNNWIGLRACSMNSADLAILADAQTSANLLRLHSQRLPDEQPDPKVIAARQTA